MLSRGGHSGGNPLTLAAPCAHPDSTPHTRTSCFAGLPHSMSPCVVLSQDSTPQGGPATATLPTFPQAEPRSEGWAGVLPGSPSALWIMVAKIQGRRKPQRARGVSWPGMAGSRLAAPAGHKGGLPKDFRKGWWILEGPVQLKPRGAGNSSKRKITRLECEEKTTTTLSLSLFFSLIQSQQVLSSHFVLLFPLVTSPAS